MPRSSRHKKSSKDRRERREDRESDSSDSEDSRDRRRSKEEAVVRVSRSRDEECSGSKRPREKIDSEKVDSAAKSKASGDSKSSRKRESVGLVAESERVKRSRGSGKVDSKREAVKSLRSADRGLDREDVEGEARGKGSSECTTKAEVGNAELKQDFRNVELDKELEKQAGKKKDLLDEDKYQKVIRDSNGKRVLTKDEKHKEDRSDKFQEDIGRDHRDRDRSKDKYQEDIGRVHKDRDRSKGKYQEDIGRDHSDRDRFKDKYQEDIGKDHRDRDRSKDKYLEGIGRGHRDGDRSKGKYQEDIGRDHSDRDRSKDKYQEDIGKDHRDRDRSKDKYQEGIGRDRRDGDRSKDKYQEDIGRDHRDRDRSKDRYQEDTGRDHRDHDRSKDRYQEDTGRDHRDRDRSSDKYQEDIGRGHRDRDRSKDKYQEDKGRDHRDRDRSKDKYREDTGRDSRVHDRSRDKHQEDIGRERMGRDKQSSKDHPDDRSYGKRQEDIGRERMGRDKQSSKDHPDDRSYGKHSRDESISIVENPPKKSKMLNSGRDGSRCPDDRTTRHKDDYQGKKKLSNDEDNSDFKRRNTKEHHYEMEEKVNSGKGVSLSDREKSHSRVVVDGGLMVSCSGRQSSPSIGIPFPKDKVRQSSEQVNMTYRDSVLEDTDCVTVTSSQVISIVLGVPERNSESRLTDESNVVETPINKDQSHLAELPSERSPLLDAEVSPLQLKDTVHSSTSIEGKPSNRTPVRCSIDVDVIGHRSCGSKDVRDDSAYEDKGSKDWPTEKPFTDETFRADDDTLSVPSSVNRTNHLPVSSSSIHPRPPCRTSVGNSSALFVEDHRGNSSNPYKKFNEPNMGRGSGNAWEGVPDWSTPETNGFVPFRQGRPPGGFHPVVQKSHGSPVFGGRNNPGGNYCVSGSDRYSGHGRSFRWQNQADEADSSHLHGRNGSNGCFEDESRVHKRPDWDQTTHTMTEQVWEAGTEMWKEDNQFHAAISEGGAGKPGQRSWNDRSRSVSRSESIEIKLLDDIPVEHVAVKAFKQVALEKNSEPSKTLKKHNFCHVYLSKLDISVDLAHPDLYKQCISLLDLERISTNGDSKDLSTEGIEAGGKITHSSFVTPHFPKIKDSILKKAMALYQQQREKMIAKVPISVFIQAGEHILPTNEVKLYPNPPRKGEELSPSAAGVSVEELAPVFSNVIDEVDASILVKVDDSVPTSCQERVEEPLLYSEEAKGDDSVSNSRKEVLEPLQSPGSEQPGATLPTIYHVEKVDADATITDVENPEAFKNQPQLTMQPVVNSSTNLEDHVLGEDPKSCCSANTPERENIFSNDIASGSPLGLTDNPEAYEASAPVLVECKSVNLSRIHSPESTH